MPTVQDRDRAVNANGIIDRIDARAILRAMLDTWIYSYDHPSAGTLWCISASVPGLALFESQQATREEAEAVLIRTLAAKLSVPERERAVGAVPCRAGGPGETEGGWADEEPDEEEGPITGPAGPHRVSIQPRGGWIWAWFPTSPGQVVTRELRASGYRWDGGTRSWYSRDSDLAWRVILGIAEIDGVTEDE